MALGCTVPPGVVDLLMQIGGDRLSLAESSTWTFVPSSLTTEGNYSVEICGTFGIVRSVSPNCWTIYKC